jgi:TRAP-type C4-dicarboxylate transport system permease small subunit
MTSRSKYIQAAIKVLMVAGAAALVAMMTVIVANIFGRLFFKAPVMGTVEVAGFTGAILVAIAVGFAERDHRNVIVEILVSRFPPRIKAFVDSFTLILSLGGLVVLFWAMFDYAFKTAVGKEYTFTLGINPAPFQFIWSFGVLILCIYVLQHIIQYLKRGFQK